MIFWIRKLHEIHLQFSPVEIFLRRAWFPMIWEGRNKDLTKNVELRQWPEWRHDFVILRVTGNINAFFLLQTPCTQLCNNMPWRWNVQWFVQKDSSLMFMQIPADICDTADVLRYLLTKLWFQTICLKDLRDPPFYNRKHHK